MIDAIGGFIQTALELAIAWCKPTTIKDLAEKSLRERERQAEDTMADQ
jgi:hypothetical protein